MTEHHIYIRRRIEQQEELRKAALSELEVVFLDLPCIFGVTPGLLPL